MPGQLLVEKLAFPWTANVADEGMTGGGDEGLRVLVENFAFTCTHTVAIYISNIYI